MPARIAPVLIYGRDLAPFRVGATAGRPYAECDVGEPSRVRIPS
jgi:hypothetical protein